MLSLQKIKVSMKYKVGDRVKFLNDVGGGMINKIISPTMVIVTAEDGFDIPIMINEILLAESSDSKGTVFNQNFSQSDILPETSSASMDRASKLQKFSSLNSKPNGVYLAYIPQDQVWLLKDEIDLFIINFTPYEILFNLILENDRKFNGIDYGSVESFSKIHIQTIQRDDLTKWLNGFVQVLFFKNEDSTIRLPLHTDFKIKPARFQNKDSYFSTNFMEEKGVLYYLGQSVSAKEFQQIELQKNTENIQRLESQPIGVFMYEKTIDKYKTDKHTAEVDLHIESIVDDHSKIDNSQILETQKRLFIKCLDSAIAEKLQKVTFIHGVGNGFLKREITTILKEYSNLHYFDASMQKYGCGATEVLINTQ
jgi:hypothetical protein